MKRYISFLLAIVLLCSLVPAGNVSAAFVSNTSLLTFDDVQAGSSVTALPGYKGNFGAQISTDPADAANQALYLCDSANSTWPYFHYTFAASDKLTVSFDLYAAQDNVFAVQILNGSRANRNTAYWLQFRAGGIYSYDLNGSAAGYVKVSDASIVLGQWNHIRLEITTAAGGEMQIYLNDAMVGIAAKPSTSVIGGNAMTANGVYISAAQHKNRGFYVDNLQADSMVEIPDMVTTDEGMHLQADARMDTLQVEVGKILDLRGYTLTVGDLACFGSIVDTSKDNTGKLIVEDLALSDLKYMPVYDSANGYYRFFTYTLKNLGPRDHEDGSRTYGFAIDFANPEAYALLAEADHGVDVTMQLKWAAEERLFAFDADLVRQYAALQVKYPALQAAMTLTVTGLDALDSGVILSVTPAVQAAGVTLAGTTMGEIIDGGGEDSTQQAPLLEVQMGGLFDIADNSETVGLPANDPIVKDDFSASGGKYGFTQIPNAVYDPASGKVYVNYTRHRDIVVDYPYDSTRVYNVETLLNAKTGAQLQDDYVQMRTEDTMMFTAMAKLPDGRIFCQSYVAYYLSRTQATTYSWIVDTDGSWMRIEGILTIPQSLTLNGAQPNSTWHRYAFSRCLEVLDDGTLLATMYGPYGAIMVQSKDYGATWSYRSTIAESALGLDEPYTNTDGTDITWFEPAVTRCADGSLLCVMRTWRNKPLWQCRSYDDGLSWTEPMLMPGMEGKSIYPHLVLLSNGVLAMATGVPGDRIYFSLDGCGYNWDYCVDTYTQDTTGNSAIAEVGYNASTGTVTLLALGDKGFHNTSPSGIWGRIVTVKRTHADNPVLGSAVISADQVIVGPGETAQASVYAVFDTDRGLIDKDYTVQWHSLAPQIATIDETGKITANTVGTAQFQAMIFCQGRAVRSNVLTLEVHDRNTLHTIEVTASAWVLKVGSRSSLTVTAYNSFGEPITDGSVKWSYKSLDANRLSVSNTGYYWSLKSGVAELQVTATRAGVALTKNVTIIIESDTWVTEGFESTTLPKNCIVSSGVSITTSRKYSGSRALYIKDDSASIAPYLRLNMPDSKGVIVEFMLYVENNAHSPNFGIGRPLDNGTYNYTCNAVRIGLLYNSISGAQGYQAYDGTAWSQVNRTNVVPIRQWNKIRLEITTDKPAKMYVNGTYLGEMPMAAVWENLNTLYFSTGGSTYTGDAFYVDDIRYMKFN